MPNAKKAAKKAAENAARAEGDGPDTKYKIKYRARVPLVDAGQVYTTKVTGKSTKNEIRRALESEGYSVERIERAVGFGIYW